MPLVSGGGCANRASMVSVSVMITSGEKRRRPARSWRFYVLLSICVAFLTIAMKAVAYLLTGSIGLLSDAAQSLVNLAGTLGAFWALSTASRPPDEEHA